MINRLWSGATGMLAQSLKVDCIANNIANINTGGFKKSRILFGDLFYRTIGGPGQPVLNPEAHNIRLGTGVRAAAARVDFRPGQLFETGRELDFAIEGNGFFRVILPDGREAFTRAGSFYFDANGSLVTAEGYHIDFLPAATTPAVSTLAVDPNGYFRLYDAQGVEVGEGRLTLFYFTNPPGLEAMGGGLWRETENSGEPVRGFPGEEGLGLLRQRYLEGSNVNLVEEMTNLILAQRAYEISSRAVRTADEMWGLANQIRR